MSEKSRPFGYEGDRWFVNSAHNIGRDAVDRLLPDADADGSVDGHWVTGTVGTPLAGRVAIRLRIQEIAGVGDDQARLMLAALIEAGVVQFWRPLRLHGTGGSDPRAEQLPYVSEEALVAGITYLRAKARAASDSNLIKWMK